MPFGNPKNCPEGDGRNLPSKKNLQLLVGLTDNPVSQAALKAYQNIEPGAMGVSKTEWNDFMKKLKRFE